MQEMKFKTEDKINIHDIQGVELNVIPEQFGWTDYDSNQIYHRIIGEFFYCGLLLDGQLIISEKDFNDIIVPLNLTLNKVDGTKIYFRNHDKEQLHIMNQLLLKAKCIGDEEVESDTEENFTFHLIG